MQKCKKIFNLSLRIANSRWGLKLDNAKYGSKKCQIVVAIWGSQNPKCHKKPSSLYFLSMLYCLLCNAHYVGYSHY